MRNQSFGGDLHHGVSMVVLVVALAAPVAASLLLLLLLLLLHCCGHHSGASETAGLGQRAALAGGGDGAGCGGDSCGGAYEGRCYLMTNNQGVALTGHSPSDTGKSCYTLA